MLEKSEDQSLWEVPHVRSPEQREQVRNERRVIERLEGRGCKRKPFLVIALELTEE
jgi:hypothetical protein